MTRALDVYLDTELVGALTETQASKMTFAYRDTATRPISVSMPLQKKQFDEQHCEAFFSGLLPEGDEARKALGKRFGISANNTFSLLRAIGAECAGALSILEAGMPIPLEQNGIDILSEEELAAHIRELPRRPLFVGVKGIRLSLSGVQDKAAVSVVRNEIGIPKGGPTTHILKPDLVREPGIIYCEHLCMKSAASLNIEVASVQLGKAEDQVYLLVERYDRHRQNTALNRIHQEDFCQALAILPTNKYEDDGGPSLKDCFQLLDRTAAPARERIKLLTAVIFNFLVSNMDAHGKNFSLLHHQEGIRLAPLYDIICTTAFPNYSKQLAMTIGDEDDPKEVYAHYWRTFCQDINYSFPAFKRIAKRLYTNLPSKAAEEYQHMQAAGWSHPACERAIKIIAQSCSELESRLNV